MKSNRHLFSLIGLYGFMTAVCLACLLPLVLVVSASFTESSAFTLNGFRLIPDRWSLASYRLVLKDADQLLASYKVTIAVTVLGTLLSLLITSLLAYPLSRKDFAYKNPLSFYVFFTMLFNGGLVPLYILVTQYLHLKDTIWALILPALINPFYVLLTRTFFQTIPEAVIESATLDGITEWQMYIRIILPLSGPILATIGLFTTMNYWNDWFSSLLYIEDRNLISLQYLLIMMKENIEYMLMNPNSDSSLRDVPSDTVRMAMAVLTIGPVAFVYMFFQKYFVRGMVIGAVKG
ncbi:carbohydrate ABC transporter permease [Paenibacillus chartarius]|uniref:Carbohydrate ABC transporter permease n=1 Tax=Paenibacillus chartarius TaxID=747481 RepID=A0ABV6DQ76_9BACL